MMKFLFAIGVVAALFPSLLFAQTWLPDREGFCKASGELAVKILDVRQQEIPISRTMAIFMGEESDEPFLQKISATAHKIVLEAYRQPRMTNDVSRGLQIKQFRNQVELDCYMTFED